MTSIAEETRTFIVAALDTDAALLSLEVSGTDDANLRASIDPGRPAPRTVPMGSGTRVIPSPTFSREVLVELVVRMQRRRWQRFDDFVLGLAPPPSDYWHLIRARLDVSPEFGPGWHDLVTAAADWIVELGGSVETGQIKEKYGGLRWYIDGDLKDLGDKGFQIVDAAEFLSEFVCEDCGAPGQNTGRGWMRTRCGGHDDA